MAGWHLDTKMAQDIVALDLPLYFQTSVIT